MTPIKTQYAGLKSKIDDQLSRWSVAAFGIGAAGEAVYLGLFNTFITIFYNQALQRPPLLKQELQVEYQVIKILR